ncbi:MAG: hypothetical protein KBE65_10800 [Phycisphaerae bacterium]|nr:hypothetical protein [Phycisphaerae bacterium]
MADHDILLECIRPFETVDAGRLQKALDRGRIDVARIADDRLRRFLGFLAENGLEDIVLTGGAVRDALTGARVHDFDFTVAIPMSPQEMGPSESNLTQATPAMVQRAESILRRLARELGTTAEQIRDYRHPAAFEGVELAYLGPHRLKEDGRLIRGVVFDRPAGRLSVSQTAPEILLMGLDPSGRLYGHREALTNWLGGVARLKGDLKKGRNLWPPAILKLFRLRYQFGLAVLRSDYELAKSVLAGIGLGDTGSASPMTRELQTIMDVAVDRDLVARELADLGLPVP